jgi:hypothetical protein
MNSRNQRERVAQDDLIAVGARRVLQEKGSLKGHVQIINAKTMEVVRDFDNLVVTVGKQQAAKLFNGVGTDPFKYIALGDATLPTWAVSTAYSVGDRVVPTTGNGYYYECTVAGTSDAATEPTWPTTIGGTVVDGTVTWVCKGGTSAVAGDVTLMHEITTNGGARTLGTTTVASNVAKIEATFNFTGDLALTEIGLLDAATAGNLACRQVYAVLNVKNGDQFIFRWEVTFN